MELNATDTQELKGLLTKLGEKYDKAIADVGSFGAVTSETKTAIGKIEAGLLDLQAKTKDEGQKIAEQMTAIKEALAQMPKSLAPVSVKSVGEQFVEHPEFLEGLKNSRGKHSIAVQLKWPKKAISGLSASWPQQLPIVPMLGETPYGVRQLIPQGTTTSGAVEYFRETAETNNAAPVAELAAKPESSITFTPVTAVVQTIAHYFKISKQCYDDLPFLASLINSRGIYMLKVKEDDQLLNGDGTSPNLQGFVELATAAPVPDGTAPNMIDAIGKAVFDLAGKGFMPDGTVVNPGDWGNVALLKNSFGQYVYSNPVTFSPNNLIWGTRVVMSSNMTAGDFLVGAFNGNSLLVDREEVNVQVANYDQDDFTKNRLTVLIEERLVNLVLNATAFETGEVPVPEA